MLTIFYNISCSLATTTHYIIIIILRPGQYEEPRALIDFHPSVSDKEERVEGSEGCPRCGYKVFEAERMMAAGSVRKIF